ncbi:MAG: hypothetical protein ACRECO_04715 [Xanthobacteraceae bacterium]
MHDVLSDVLLLLLLLLWRACNPSRSNEQVKRGALAAALPSWRPLKP